MSSALIVADTVALALVIADANEPDIEVTFVSLPAETIQGVTSARVENLRTGSSVDLPVTDGGIDPYPIAVRVGDTLETTVSRLTGGDSTLLSVVPRRRRPAVVRTSPTRGKKDVPLNARATIVFSEPVDPATVSAQSIVLLRQGQTVAGQIELSNDGLRVDFVPAEQLVAETDYALTVTTVVRDSDGEPLESPVTTVFTTVTPASLTVIVTTDGLDQDDAYNVAVAPDSSAAESAAGLPVVANGTLLFDLWEGSYVVLLREIASNCSVAGENPVSRTLSPGDKAEVRMSVVCGVTGLEIAYAGTQSICSPDPCTTEQIQSNTDIYVTTPSGRVSRLTTDAARDTRPSWSPDGRRIAFRSDRDGNGEIYVMNADGSSQTRLTSDAGADDEPVWSPDGSKIAFVSQRDGNAELYVMNAAGGDVTRLTNHPAEDHSPSWSPDGTQVAFASNRDTTGGIRATSSIFTLRLADMRVFRLTADFVDDVDPAWSPDGTRIAFSRFVPTPGFSTCVTEEDNYITMCRWDVLVMNADGSGLLRLDLPTEPGMLPDGWWRSIFVARKPGWSPDGTRIAVGVFYCLSDFGGADCHGNTRLVLALASGAGGFLELTTGLVSPDRNQFPWPEEASPSWRPGSASQNRGASVRVGGR